MRHVVPPQPHHANSDLQKAMAVVSPGAVRRLLLRGSSAAAATDGIEVAVVDPGMLRSRSSVDGLYLMVGETGGGGGGGGGSQVFCRVQVQSFEALRGQCESRWNDNDEHYQKTPSYHHIYHDTRPRPRLLHVRYK